jgi:hypothetical protein
MEGSALERSRFCKKKSGEKIWRNSKNLEKTKGFENSFGNRK